MADVATSVWVGVPHVHQRTRKLIASGLWCEVDAEARLLASGYLAVRWDAARIEYAVAWSNSLWEAMEIDLASEHEQIEARIRDTIAAMPRLPSPPFLFGEEAMATRRLPVQVAPRLQAWARWGQLMARDVWAWLWLPPGV